MPFKISAVRRRLLSASVIVVVLGLVANLIGLFKEQWVAHRFGIGDAIDVFSIGLTIPIFVATLLSSAIGAVVIPGYLAARSKSKDFDFIIEVLCLLSALLFFSLIVTASVGWVLMPELASGFGDQKLAETKLIFLFLCPLIVIQCAASFFDGIVNAQSKFFLSASSNVLIPIGAILILYFSSHNDANVLVLGLYAGYVLKLSVLVSFVFYRDVESESVRTKISLKALSAHHGVAKEFFAIIFSSAILGVLPIIGQAYIATLEAGSVATLGYANRLINVGLVILSGLINTIVLPLLAQQSINNRVGAFRIGSKLAGYAIGGGLLLILPFYILLPDIVRILFERGEFKPDTTRDVVEVLRYLIPYLPFYIAGLVLARVVVSLGLSRIFYLGNFLSVAIYWIVCAVGINYLGINVVGVALTAVYIFSVLYLYISIRKSLF